MRVVGVDIDDTLQKLALLRNLSTRFQILSVALERKIYSLSIKDFHGLILGED